VGQLAESARESFNSQGSFTYIKIIKIKIKIGVPMTVLASLSTAEAILISEFPPPYRTLLFLMVLTRTQTASWKERSASSKMCLLDPLKTKI